MKQQRSRGACLVSLLLDAGLACGLVALLGGIALAWYSAQMISGLPPNMPADAQMFGIILGAVVAIAGLVLLLVFGLALLVRWIVAARRQNATGTAGQ